MDARDLLRPAAPVIGQLIKAVQRLKGAEMVSEPVRLDPPLRLPGVPTLTRLEHERIEEFTSKVVDQLAEFRRTELSSVSPADWNAAVGAAQETLAHSAPLDLDFVLAANLEPEQLVERLVARDPDRVRATELVGDAIVAYVSVLLACSAQLIEFFTSRPNFSARVDVELVRRTGALLENRLVMAPEQRYLEFERQYRAAVEGKLRSLRLFGVRLGRISNSYPLTTAYISLSGAAENSKPVDLGSELGTSRTGKARLPQILGTNRRLLIRGEAGSGKTTLLQWVATVTASGSVQVPELAGKVPFFVRLRNFAGKPLPHTSAFAAQISEELDVPEGWVRSVLLERRGLVLVDGVDELPEGQREAAREWLDGMTSQFEGNHFVVTSRPPAAAAGWLSEAGFKSFRILPMDMADIRDFIRHWHNTMRVLSGSEQDATEIVRLQTDLEKTFGRRRDLRKLATNPLLCALICALHVDRLRELPRDRVELYRAALEMLLSERDRQRQVPTYIDDISRRDQEALLAHLAYWMIRNDRLDVTQAEVASRINHERRGMPHLTASSADLAKYLVLRSGVLQTVTAERSDFLHRTFQEYLAAQAVLDYGDLDFLVQNAERDQWREVVPLVVAHANRRECEQVVTGLIERGDRDTRLRYKLHLLAAACLNTASYLSPETISLVTEKTIRMIPPVNDDQTQELIRVGSLVLDLIPDLEAAAPNAVHQLLNVVQGIGGPEALPILSRFAALPSRDIRMRLAENWPDCDPVDYVRTVLDSMILTDVTVAVNSDKQLEALEHTKHLQHLEVSTDIAETPKVTNSLGRHSNLQSLTLVNVEIDGPDTFAHLHKLRNLQMYGVSFRQSLQVIEGLPVHQLLLNGITLNPPDVLSSLPDLEELTLGTTTVAAGSTIALPDSLHHLKLGDSPHLFGIYESAPEKLLVAYYSANSWHRTRLSTFNAWTGMTELHMVGWPTAEEVEIIQSMPSLRRLRILVPDDPLREDIREGGTTKYPYPPLLTGLAETTRRLPAHVELQLGIFQRYGNEDIDEYEDEHGGQCVILWRNKPLVEPLTPALRNRRTVGRMVVNGIEIALA